MRSIRPSSCRAELVISIDPKPSLAGVGLPAVSNWKARGKIAAYGVSVEKIEEALKAIEFPGVASVQIIYNIFRQRPAELFFKEARRKNIAVMTSANTAAFEAFKSGIADIRTEGDPTRWATGYDFPAVKEGKVTLEKIEQRTPAPATGFAFNNAISYWALQYTEALNALPPNLRQFRPYVRTVEGVKNDVRKGSAS